MQDFNRRQTLSLGGATLMTPAAMAASPTAAVTPQPTAPLNAPLLNTERAHDQLERLGVDALVCALPQNVYYLTNSYPLLSRMGISHVAFAVLPRDRRRRPILITGHFGYYYTIADDQISRFADVMLFTAPAEDSAFEYFEQTAQPAALPAVHDEALMIDSERARRKAMSQVSGDLSASAEQALVRALRDLGASAKTLAVDDQSLIPMLQAGGVEARFTNGENLIRTIRLQKSAQELKLARYAADANAQAGLVAARKTRAGAMLSEVRAEYAKECALRGLTPEFMVVDKVSSTAFDKQLVDGQAFLIDCVSHFHHYHGDYGRTIFLGEPTQKMKKATQAMSALWDEVRAQLRPGITYSQIREMGQKAAAKTQSDIALFCNPHSVGMFHTDEPSTSQFQSFQKPDITLEENMILSIDVPMTDAGVGGSAHLEDLMLITKDGAEPLNDIGDQVITL